MNRINIKLKVQESSKGMNKLALITGISRCSNIIIRFLGHSILNKGKAKIVNDINETIPEIKPKERYIISNSKRGESLKTFT